MKKYNNITIDEYTITFDSEDAWNTALNIMSKLRNLSKREFLAILYAYESITCIKEEDDNKILCDGSRNLFTEE